MKIKTVVGFTVLAIFSLLAIGSFAQRGSAQTDTSNSNAASAMSGSMGQRGMMNSGSMYGGMMNGSMMNGPMMYGRGMMGRNMMGNYSAMQKLMNRLESDVSSARAEAGSAAIKSKLDDAGALVSKLRGELSNSWGMMMRYMPMNGNSYCYWNQRGQQQTKQ